MALVAALLLGTLASASQGPQLQIRLSEGEPIQLDVFPNSPGGLYKVYYAPSLRSGNVKPGVLAAGIALTNAVRLLPDLSQEAGQMFFWATTEPLPPDGQGLLPEPLSDQQVTVRDVTLSVPAGLLSGALPVGVQVLNPATTGLRTNVPGFQVGAIYEIQVGSESTFETPITIEMPYDPTRLSPEVPLDDALIVSYWLPESGRWASVPCTADASTGRLRFQTRHLSIWAVRYLTSGYRSIRSDLGHARVVYDPRDRVYNTVTDQFVSSIQDYAQFVADKADAACEAYSRAGFQIPEEQWFIIADQSIAVESEWVGRSGDIYIPINFAGYESLDYEIGHELFHAVQNCYYNAYAAGLRRWWHEACATYASYHYHIGKTFPFRSALSSNAVDFLDLPLNTVNSRHEYVTAEFLGFLFEKVGSTMDFKTHFDALQGYGIQSMLRRLESTTERLSSSSLARLYRLFAADFWLNRDGVLEAFNPLVDAQGQPADVPVLSPTESRSGFEFHLRGGYTASYHLQRIDSFAQNRRLKIKVNQLAGKAAVDVHVIQNFAGRGARWPLATLSSIGAESEVTVPAGHYLVLIGVNHDPSSGSSVAGSIMEAGITYVSQEFDLRGGALSLSLPDSSFNLAGTWTLAGRLAGMPSASYDGASHYYIVQAAAFRDNPITLTCTYAGIPDPPQSESFPGNGLRVVTSYKIRHINTTLDSWPMDAIVVKEQTSSNGALTSTFEFNPEVDDPNIDENAVFNVQVGVSTREQHYSLDDGHLVWDTDWMDPWSPSLQMRIFVDGLRP